MGCNCGKKRNSKTGGTRRATGTGPRKRYALVLPAGRRVEFGSRLEAEAANARAGNVGKIVNVA